MMRLLINILILNFFHNIQTFGLQTQMFTGENCKLPKLISQLKINSDNVFDKIPDSSIFNNEFVFTINDTNVFNKQEYISLYRKVKSCRRFISKGVEINNTFNIYPNEQYISSNAFCRFSFRFTSKTIEVTVDSKYSFDNNFQVIQHNIENIEINDKKVNVLALLSEYLNAENNESIIGFFTFVKRY